MWRTPLTFKSNPLRSTQFHRLRQTNNISHLWWEYENMVKNCSNDDDKFALLHLSMPKLWTGEIITRKRVINLQYLTWKRVINWQLTIFVQSCYSGTYADILKGGFFFPPLRSFPPPSLPLPSSPLEVGPLNPARGSGGVLWAPPAGSGQEPQPKSNLVHFSHKIWPLVATFSMIFFRINWPN